MVTIHYIGGSWKGGPLEFRDTNCRWEYCPHMDGSEKEGTFYAYNSVYEKPGDLDTRYKSIECELCARRVGHVW